MIDRGGFDLPRPTPQRCRQHGHAVSATGHSQRKSIICADRSPDQPTRRDF
jgi:hypothetical protein